MQAKRFMSHSVLALCSDISALMNKGLTQQIILTY